MKRFLEMPSPAMVVALLALFVAMGGTGWAVARNSVGTKQLKNRAVTTKKLKNRVVTTKKLRNRAVTRSKIRNRSVGTSQLGNNSVTGAKIAESSLGTVPSATNATNAANFERYVPFGLASAQNGGQVTLATYGPFTIYGKCETPVANLEANVFIATTEDGSSFGAQGGQQGTFGPGTAEADRAIRDGMGASSTGAPAHSKGDEDGFNAMAPSGAALSGDVQGWASQDASLCRWSGYLLKTG